MTATLFNIQVKKEDRRKVEEFLLRFESNSDPQEPDWLQMLATVEMLNAAFGGEDLRGGGHGEIS